MFVLSANRCWREPETPVKAIIQTRVVGQSFGCKAIVKRGTEVLYETRVFPFNHEHAAVQLAKSWCDENNVEAAAQ